MLQSTDEKTNEVLKPLCMLTPAEYEALIIRCSFENQIKAFQKRHGIKIKSVSINDEKIDIEWEGKQ